MKTIAFFNNKGGVGKTSLIYHLAWMFHCLGKSVVVVDLDPQSNLTTMCLPMDRIEQLWTEDGHGQTVFGAALSMMDRPDDIGPGYVEELSQTHSSTLSLVPGDIGLSLLDDRLADAWQRCESDDPAKVEDGLRITGTFHRLIERAAEQGGAKLVLLDMGPNPGALNRAALVASDYIITPLPPDIFSVQGLKGLGPTLLQWREGWRQRRKNARSPGVSVPAGDMSPIGYVILQSLAFGGNPMRSYQQWIDKVSVVYQRAILQQEGPLRGPDPYLLATMRHHRSLMELAQEARKPMFLLKPAEGALGSHAAAVRDCYGNFERLARTIAERIEVSLE